MKQAKKRSRAEQSKATHRAILEAAEACFAARGFAGTSTRQIAQRAEVTQPLVMHYFGSKDGLFKAVIQAAVDQYIEEQSKLWAGDAHDAALMIEGLVILFRWVGRRQHLTRLMMWARLEGKAQASPQMLALWQRVGKRFELTREAGILRADLPIREGMILVDAITKGFWDRRDAYLQVIAADGGEPEGLDQRMEGMIVDSLIRTLVSVEHHEAALQSYRRVRSVEA